MGEETALPSPRGELQVFWLGWIAAPGWWLSQFEIRYSLVPWACHHGHRWLVLGFGVFSLAVSLLLVMYAWRWHSRQNGREPRKFLAATGAWMAILFALVVFAQLLPDLFIGPCRQ